MPSERTLLDYHLDHIFTLYWIVDEVRIGQCPQGYRVNGYISDGKVSGPKVNGKIRPVDGNWAHMRSDAVIVVDYRVTIETEDGALICAACKGIADPGEDALQKLPRGEPLARFRPLRWGVQSHTADPSYLWLNRVYGLGIGQYDSQTHELTVDVYAVR